MKTGLIALVRQTENLSFTETWVSEHHCNEANISSGMLVSDILHIPYIALWNLFLSGMKSSREFV